MQVWNEGGSKVLKKIHLMEKIVHLRCRVSEEVLSCEMVYGVFSKEVDRVRDLGLLLWLNNALLCKWYW